MRVCAEYLRQYNNGLILRNTIRMHDALSLLNNYYEEQYKKKSAPDEEQNIQITDTERFLFNLFKGTVDFFFFAHFIYQQYIALFDCTLFFFTVKKALLFCF